MTRKELGDRIRELRSKQGLTQQELADKAGINLRTITNVELGLFNVKIDTVNKIAEALGAELKIEK